MADEKDDVVDEVIENDQATTTEAKAGESKEELSLEKVAQIAKATQKGYTVQAQQLAQIQNNLEAIAEAMNAQSGASKQDDEYVTVSKLREVLAEQQTAVKAVQEQANNYIDNTLIKLETEGVISNDEEKDSLLKFALKIKEPDLEKASLSWREVKAAKETAKKQIHQEAGSKVGTSSKTTSKDNGVDIREIRKMDWFSF